MFKKILSAIALLVLACVVIYLIRYNSGHCVCESIPMDSEAALYVNTRNIEKHFVDDILMNPLSYLSSDKSTALDSTKQGIDTLESTKLLDGISLPDVFVVYRPKGASNSWRTVDFEISDETLLKKYLHEKGFTNSALGNSKVFVQGKKQASIHGNKIRFQYSGLSESHENITSFLKEGDVIFDFISTSTADIVYADEKGQHLEVNFTSGSVDVDGEYDFKVLEELSQVVGSKGLGQVSANFDVDRLGHLIGQEWKDKFANFTKLDVDSLLSFWDGGILSSITNFKTISDTIKTYEYDDDFNKIEVQKIDYSLAPNYTIQLGMDSSGVQYMKSKRAIVKEEGSDVLAIMPLVKTYVTMNSRVINLYTNNSRLKTNNEKLKLKAVLDLQDHLTKEAKEFLSLPSAMEKVQNISLVINNSNIVTGKILTSGNRNALVDLVGN